MPYTDADAAALHAALAPLAPVVGVQRSTLGGEERASLLVLVCLTPRSGWSNGIMENHPHTRFHLDHAGNLDQFHRSGAVFAPRLRLSRGNTPATAAARIATYLRKMTASAATTP